MNAFNSNIQLIQDGEAISAANTNPPLIALQSNCNYLNQVVQAMGASQALFIQNASLNPLAAVGQPVAWNAAQGYYDVAIANGTNLQLVVGLLLSKSSASVGTILQMGYSALSLTNALPGGSSVTAGRYFLSSSVAGQLSTSPSAILVCIADGSGNVFCLPQNFNLEPTQPYQITGGGTSSNALLTVATINGPRGILGTLSLLNTGATNNLGYTVVVNDQFGHTGATASGTIAATGSQTLALGSTTFGAGIPPYTSVVVSVNSASSGNPTTFSLAGAVLY